MQRVNFHLTDDQLAWLRGRQESTGVPVAEQIRRAIDRERKRTMSLVSNLNGTFSLDELKRMTWPIAWSPTKDQGEAEEEEAALKEFARKAAAELQEYYDYASSGEGDFAVRVVNGEVVEIVGV